MTKPRSILQGRNCSKHRPPKRSERRLAEAAERDQTELVAKLLRAGTSPDSRDLRGATALGHAAFNMNAEVASLLLTAGADPNLRSSTNDDPAEPTPLMIAAMRSGPRALRGMIELSAPHSDDTLQSMMAAVFGDEPAPVGLEGESLDTAPVFPRERPALGTVRALLQAGADIEARDGRGMTALSYCAHFGGEPEVARALLAASADPDATDIRSMSALAHARQEGNLQVAQVLDQAGAKATGEAGPALLEAIHNRNFAEVLAALEAGADPNFHALDDQSALFWACERCSLATVETLLEAGADPNFVPEHGTPALFSAAAEGSAEILELLLGAGANKAITYGGISPLAIAASLGHTDIVKLLGGDPNLDMGLAANRGFGKRRIDEYALLVRADIETVADSFRRLRSAEEIKSGVIGQAVEITGPTYVAYQLVGHSWTVIQSLFVTPVGSVGMDDQDADWLSHRLETDALFVLVSDSSFRVTYSWFDAGRRVERFFYEPDLASGGDGMRIELDSLHRQVDREAMQDGFGFTEEFLRERDAYLPGWSEAERRVKAPGETAYLRAFSDADLEGMAVIVL